VVTDSLLQRLPQSTGASGARARPARPACLYGIVRAILAIFAAQSGSDA
jgi:hypothetical protein